MNHLVPALTAISSASSEDLNTLIEAIRLRRALISNSVKRSFRVGAPVQFTGRNGVTVKGTVTQILQKNIRVKADNGVEWRVSPSLLSAA